MSQAKQVIRADANKLPSLIIQLKEGLGVTLDDIANIIGVSRSTLARVMAKQTTLTPESRTALEELFLSIDLKVKIPIKKIRNNTKRVIVDGVYYRNMVTAVKATGFSEHMLKKLMVEYPNKYRYEQQYRLKGGMDAFGDRIKEAGILSVDIINILGISANTYYKFIHKETSIGEEQAEALTSLLGVSLRLFLIKC